MNHELKITSNEFMEKYGDVLVAFSYYYKYKFTFKGPLPDGKVLVCWRGGGDIDDIYRFEVTPDPITVSELWPNEGEVRELTDGAFSVVESF